MDRFLFELGQRVKLVESGEQGLVMGRAEYRHTENHYFVRYMDGSGRQVEQWWGQSALDAA